MTHFHESQGAQGVSEMAVVRGRDIGWESCDCAGY